MSASMPLPRIIAMSEFTPLVGKTLLADCDPKPAELQLMAVAPLVNHARLERPPFILTLRSGPTAMLVDGAYAMRGEGFGPDLVSIARIAPPPAAPPGHYYQAVFN